MAIEGPVSTSWKPRALPGLAALVLVILMAMGGDLLLVFLLMASPIWLIHHLLQAYSDKPRRRRWLVELGIWLTATAAGSAILAWHKFEHRREADRLVQSITAYHAAHGAWPARLRDVNADEGVEKGMGINYVREPDQTTLFYYDVPFPQCQWWYHFDGQGWQQDCI